MEREHSVKRLHLKEETIITIISYLHLAAEVCREKLWGECADEAETIIDELNRALADGNGVSETIVRRKKSPTKR